jgi:hypothetical protein
MPVVYLSSVVVLVLGLSGALMLAQTDPPSPCCAAVNFQTFNPQDVAIQLVSVERTGPDDITVTWQILNRSKAPQQFDKMAGLAAYQLVWDAEVIDLASRTRFKVASDPKTRIPVAAKHDPPRASQGIGLEAGRTLTTWAKFLVPANVTKVTVSLPGAAKPWENVAITPPSSLPTSVISSNLPLKDLRLGPVPPNGPPIVVPGGSNDAFGIVELVEAPPPGGLLVKLTSSDPDVAGVPGQITVNQGAASAETGPLYSARFPITAHVVHDGKRVTITAQAGAQMRQADLTIRPPHLENYPSFTLHDTDFLNVCVSNTYARISFKLDGPAPPGHTYVLAIVRKIYSNGANGVSETSDIAKGDRSGSFKMHIGACSPSCSLAGTLSFMIDGMPSGPARDLRNFCN